MQIKHQPLKYLDLPALRAAKKHFGFCFFFQGALFTPQVLDLMLFHTMNTDCFGFWHLGLIVTCTKRPCLFSPWSLNGYSNCLPGLAFSFPRGNSPLNTQSSPFSLCIFSCMDPCISFSGFQETSKRRFRRHLGDIGAVSMDKTAVHEMSISICFKERDEMCPCKAGRSLLVVTRAQKPTHMEAACGGQISRRCVRLNLTPTHLKAFWSQQNMLLSQHILPALTSEIRVRLGLWSRLHQCFGASMKPAPSLSTQLL